MGRIVLAILLGAVLGLVIVWFGSWAGDYIFPPSPSIDLHPELAKTMKGGMPFMGFVIKLLAWSVGALVAAWAASRSARQGAWPAWAAGGLLGLVEVLINLRPQNPVWFLILGVILVAAASFAAGRVAPEDQAYAPV